ncbi:hypothetical protein KJ633_07300 [bacterium]|nr:hypothetical protein [bacterium]
MLKYIIISLNFIFLPNLIFGQEKAEIDLARSAGISSMALPAPLSGMSGMSSNLPDISVIGDFYGKASNSKDDTVKDKLTIRSIELSLQGYLYPEMRADIFLAMHKHGEIVEAEICEGYVSFLKLFNNLSGKIGKVHVDFGKINKVHQHHRPYVDQPQVITNFFGDHGLVGEGASLSYLLPLPFFVQFDVSAWQIPSHEHEPEEQDVTGLIDADGNNIEEILVPGECSEFGMGGGVYTSRLWLSFPVSGKSELEIGASGATGQGSHYTHHKDEVDIIGIDVTYKIWPSAHTRLLFQSEYLKLKRVVPPGELNRRGFYSFLEYRFNRYWDAGVRYDHAENAFPVLTKHSSFSGIVTRHLTETTGWRFQYKQNFKEPDNIREAYIQIFFGIGAHSHPLE